MTECDGGTLASPDTGSTVLEDTGAVAYVGWKFLSMSHVARQSVNLRLVRPPMVRPGLSSTNSQNPHHRFPSFVALDDSVGGGSGIYAGPLVSEGFDTRLRL
jgi:hypothetical protein